MAAYASTHVYSRPLGISHKTRGQKGNGATVRAKKSGEIGTERERERGRQRERERERKRERALIGKKHRTDGKVRKGHKMRC